MARLPDFEGLAIFAKVVELRSFAGAAAELKLSKATVSKAVSRIEARLGARLINRTPRRLALTDAGRQLAGRAAHILAEGEAVEDAALAQATMPRGLVRLAAPISFGVLHLAPLLPEFLATYPEVAVDLHLSDAMVDLIGEGFDAAIRLAVLPDSSLVARRLCEMPRYLVGSPTYLDKHGRPRHPLHLAQHRCIIYSYSMTAETWRFTKDDDAGPDRGVRPRHPARIHFARRTCHQPAGEIAARLVYTARCCLLANAARGTAAQTGRDPREFSGREARRACEARSESSTREHAAAGRQSHAVMKRLAR